MMGFLLLFLLQPAAACPHLSGHYIIIGEDGGVTIEIRQTKCERISIMWKAEGDSTRTFHTLPLDGRPHPDRAWFGETGSGLSTATVVGRTISIVTGGAAPADTKRATRWIFWSASNGDLCSQLSAGTYHESPMWAQRTDNNRRTGEAEGDPQHRCSSRPR